MNSASGQLDFGPLLLANSELEDLVIAAAFHHVENQSVLRALLDGKNWAQAFGNGGASTPVRWDGDSRGILIYLADGGTRLIKPAQILERAKLYRPKNPF